MRINLIVFQSFNPELAKKPPVRIINNEALILVNADNVDYAMTFKFRINPELKTAHVKLDELPHLGKVIITEEEKEGLQTAL